MTLEDSVSDAQGTLTEYGGGVGRGREERAKKMLGVYPDDMATGLDRAGLGPWMGKSGDREPQATYYRTQRSMVWEYPTRDANDDTEIGLIQVRSVVYTRGRPPSHLVERIEQDALRIVTLWDTGPYSGFLSGRGSMRGFNVLRMNAGESDRHAEQKEVGHDEVNALGIPEHYLEVYDEHGNLKFNGSGTFNPWRVTEELVEGGDDGEGWQGPGQELPPQYEEWRISKQTGSARGVYYEFRPQDPVARGRLEDSGEKTVYLNGMPVGTPSESRGTVRIKNQYSRGDTFDGNYSRRGVINNSGAHPSSIRAGGLVYKVRETSGAIYLSTSRPEKEISDEGGRVPPVGGEPGGPVYRRTLTYRDDTIFTIDQDDVLGKYTPPEDVPISTGRYL